MPVNKWNVVRRFLRRLGVEAQGDGASDADLLERFIDKRDESAFELLLWRHGTMVLNVCRRVLQREEDVEDAFQAVFLTLIRKARSVSRKQAVAGWLYTVAYRVALAARAQVGRIAEHEKQTEVLAAAPAAAEAGWDDVRPMLDEEISRLPERLRLPVILCYLEGKTNAEAARRLGCPAGTVFSRLAQARELLRTRLVRRGVILSAGALAALLSDSAAGAAMTTPLVRAALKAGLLRATGSAAISTRVTALTEGVSRSMFIGKAKTAGALVLMFTLLAAGSGGLIYHALRVDAADATPHQPILPNQNLELAKKTSPKQLAVAKEIVQEKIDPNASEVRDPSMVSLLNEQINVRDFQNPMELKEALALLTDKFAGLRKDLPFQLDTHAFKEDYPKAPSVDKTVVQFPPYPKRMSLASALELVLSSVKDAKAAVVIRRGTVVITTKQRASPAELLKEQIAVDFRSTPLMEALETLSHLTGASIVVDGRLGDKAKTPVTATFKHDVSLKDALLMLTDMADVQAVFLPTAVYVTSPANAQKMLSQLDGARKETANEKKN